MVFIPDRGFFSPDNLRLLHGYGYIIATTYSRKEAKHVFSANSWMLDSADNPIMYNDKPIFAMLVEFSVDNLSLKGYLYNDLTLETSERSWFYRQIREIVGNVEKTYTDRPDPVH